VLPSFRGATWRLRLVLGRAKLLALFSGSFQACSKHLLQALVTSGSDYLAAVFFGPAKLSATAVRSFATSWSDDPTLAQDESYQDVLRRAKDEAERIGHATLSSEHLLLALAQPRNMMSAEILSQHGLLYDDLNAIIQRRGLSGCTWHLGLGLRTYSSRIPPH
jgi:ATP-dependent Clp protease ATP-binding subunit ClpA